MKTITIEFEPERIRVLSSLVSLAGSKLGDQQVMMSAAEMLNWLQAAVDASQKATKPYLVGDEQPEAKAANP